MLELAETIQFPVFPPSSIATGEHWDHLCDIDFGQEGAFITDENIKVEFIPAIRELLASFVRFNKSDKKRNDWAVMRADVYDSVPEMFIDLRGSVARRRDIVFCGDCYAMHRIVGLSLWIIKKPH